ncbi:uncharacterized protein LOC133104249 [Eubalaena glacialis]|uniref:uncharacterized protein LOC133104249 n=1 Tax=Eubalaena glacialis TaxID=27606 RepID=UPI002A59E80B|nr:uncharacterized protein LOC133104249 [Eubalaena glacialis]
MAWGWGPDALPPQSGHSEAGDPPQICPQWLPPAPLLLLGHQDYSPLASQGEAEARSDTGTEPTLPRPLIFPSGSSPPSANRPSSLGFIAPLPHETTWVPPQLAREPTPEPGPELDAPRPPSGPSLPVTTPQPRLLPLCGPGALLLQSSPHPPSGSPPGPTLTQSPFAARRSPPPHPGPVACPHGLKLPICAPARPPQTSARSHVVMRAHTECGALGITTTRRVCDLGPPVRPGSLTPLLGWLQRWGNVTASPPVGAPTSWG